MLEASDALRDWMSGGDSPEAQAAGVEVAMFVWNFNSYIRYLAKKG
jgi:hypothetical protein